MRALILGVALIASGGTLFAVGVTVGQRQAEKRAQWAITEAKIAELECRAAACTSPLPPVAPSR